MKKIFILAALIVCNYNIQAQMLTINNNTTCSITYSVIASDPATCDAAYNSVDYVIPAGSFANYSNCSSLAWIGLPAPAGSVVSGITVLDDGQLRFAGAICVPLPSNTSYTSSCSGLSVTVTWTDNGDGTATVNINN